MEPSSKITTRLQIGIALGLVYIVWGSTYLAIRYTVQTIPPFLMAAIRFLVAGPILYIWLRLRGTPKPLRAHWRSAFIIGGFLLVGGNGGVVWAEQTVPSALTALLVSVVPLWIAIFDWVRPRGHRPSFQTTIGLVLGLVGLIELIGLHKITTPGGVSAGILALILAPITWAVGSVYSKQASLPSSAFMSTAIEMIAGGILLLGTGLLLGEGARFHMAEISVVSWIALIYLIAIGALVGFTAYIWLLKHASLPVASTYAYINPVVAVLLGWLIAGEVLTARSIIGGIIILVSVALITMGSARKEKDPVLP